MIEIRQPQGGQVVRCLEESGFDHRGQFRLCLAGFELGGFAEKDFAFAIEFVARSKELMAAIKRRHAPAIKHRDELNAGMP